MMLETVSIDWWLFSGLNQEHQFMLKHFLQYLALDITANYICEIHCSSLDGLYLNTVHKLSRGEKKYRRSRESNLGLLGGKQECATGPPLTLEHLLLYDDVIRRFKIIILISAFVSLKLFSMGSVVRLTLVNAWSGFKFHSFFCKGDDVMGSTVAMVATRSKKVLGSNTSDHQMIIFKNPQF